MSVRVLGATGKMFEAAGVVPTYNNVIPYSDKQSYIYKSYFQGK